MLAYSEYDLSKTTVEKTDVRSDLKGQAILLSDFRQKRPVPVTWANQQGHLWDYFHTHTEHTHTHTQLHLFYYTDAVALTITEKSVWKFPFVIWLLETGNIHSSWSGKALVSWCTGSWPGWVFSVQSLTVTWIASRSWVDRKQGAQRRPNLDPLLWPRCAHWQWRLLRRQGWAAGTCRPNWRNSGVGSAGSAPHPEGFPRGLPWPPRAEKSTRVCLI